MATCLVASTVGGAERIRLPPGFVYLRDIDSSIMQDIRYAGPTNFTNARVPGYAAGECILLRGVAESLKLVQADLRPRNLSLKVYDFAIVPPGPLRLLCIGYKNLHLVGRSIGLERSAAN